MHQNRKSWDSSKLEDIFIPNRRLAKLFGEPQLNLRSSGFLLSELKLFFYCPIRQFGGPKGPEMGIIHSFIIK